VITVALKRVTATSANEISRSPEAALALMDDGADKDFPLEEVRMPGCLGLLLRLTPIKVTQVADRPDTELPDTLDDPDRMDLEVWDTINFFLTGAAAGGEFPAGFLVNGGQTIQTEDDETDLRLFAPDQVGEIDQHLQSLSRDDLRARIDIPRMVRERLITKPKGTGASEKNQQYFEHVLDDFESLRNFIHEAREQSACLLVMAS
jgi:hypothetical protein